MLTSSERLALLLNILGDDVSAIARTGMEGEALEDLEEALSDFDEFPPTQMEIDMVLEDFESYFKSALEEEQTEQEAEESEAKPSEGPKLLQISEEHFDIDLEPTKKFETPELTGNSQFDLNHVHPYQVATALQNESPAVISLVIRNLANEHAAKTLEFLPETLRPKIFLMLADPSPVKPVIVEQVMKATLESALKVESRVTIEESSEKMAALMRSLPRDVRAPMMEELAKRDEAQADAVKALLYRFEDLERLEDKDFQKILGKCSIDVLVVALQEVEESMLNRVLSNMSKRAKESLLEEMEFKQGAKKDEIERGRKELVAILIELAESGQVDLD